MFTLTFSMLTEGGEDTSEMQFGQIQHHTFNLIFLHELQFFQHPRQSLSFQKTLLSNCFQDYPPPTLPPRQVEIDSRGFFGLKCFSQVWCRLVSPIWRVSLSSNTNCQTWSFINTYFSSCCVNEAESHVWLLFKEIWTLTLQILASSKS